MLGKRPIKCRQRPDMTIAVDSDVKHQFKQTNKPKERLESKYISPCRMGISCDSLTIYDDLYKTYLCGICMTLNLFVALTSA